MNASPDPRPRRILAAITFKPTGPHMIYDERLSPRLAKALGAQMKAARASTVDIASDGLSWTANLAPVNGPCLAGFPSRADAIAAEVDYLNTNVIPHPNSVTP